MLKRVLRVVPYLTVIIFFLIQFNLISKSNLPLSIDETQRIYVAKSLTSNTISNSDFIDFARSQGYFLFPIPVFYLTPFASLPNYFFVTRIPNLLVGYFLYLSLFILIKRLTEENKNSKLNTVIILFILTSAWLQILTLFHLPEVFSLLFLTLTLLVRLRESHGRKSMGEGEAKFASADFRSKRRTKIPWALARGASIFLKLKNSNYPNVILFYLLILLILLSLTSWIGLIASVFLPFVYLGQKIKISPKKILTIILIFFYLPVGILIYKNSDYIKTAILQKSFISHLEPKKLADEINERQKIDYLAANRKFILPSLLRKFIYNKPIKAYDTVLKQAVSFFDFEQYAFPLMSYDIVRLSGLLPKGNLPLGYFWDLPLIFTGLFLILKNKTKLKIIFFLLVVLVLPYFFFEKRNILISASLLIPITIYLQVLGLIFLLDSAKKFRGVRALHHTCGIILHLGFLKGFVIFISLFLITPSIYEQYKLIFFDKFTYQTSDLYFFQQISAHVSKNKDDYKKIIVTDRFGPTALMTSFYLDTEPKKYWEALSKNEEIINIDNIEFGSIKYQEPFMNENLYIGFPGEFTKPDENISEEDLPKNLEIIDKILAPDELVWRYGENIWIVKVKD